LFLGAYTLGRTIKPSRNHPSINVTQVLSTWHRPGLGPAVAICCSLEGGDPSHCGRSSHRVGNTTYAFECSSGRLATPISVDHPRNRSFPSLGRTTLRICGEHANLLSDSMLFCSCSFRFNDSASSLFYLASDLPPHETCRHILGRGRTTQAKVKNREHYDAPRSFRSNRL